MPNIMIATSLTSTGQLIDEPLSLMWIRHGMMNASRVLPKPPVKGGGERVRNTIIIGFVKICNDHGSIGQECIQIFGRC